MSGILLLGTGPSSGLPQIHHVLRTGNERDHDCEQCRIGYADPSSVFCRGNVSIVVRLPRRPSAAPKSITEALKSNPGYGVEDVLEETVNATVGADGKNIGTDYYHLLVDIGKTFREQVLRYFPRFGIRTVDAIFLTHDHADACGGLDDLRELQEKATYRRSASGNVHYSSRAPTPIYLSERTLSHVRKRFDYIYNASISTDPQLRKVSACSFIPFETFPLLRNVPTSSTPTQAPEIDQILGRYFYPAEDNPSFRIQVLPVLHGGQYVCSGFALQRRLGCDVESEVDKSEVDKSEEDRPFRTELVYLSDVSDVPLPTLEVIDNLVPISCLIVDSFISNKIHYAHFSVTEVIQCVQRWRPRQTYIVGFSCFDDFIELNRRLQSELDRLRRGEPVRGELGPDEELSPLATDAMPLALSPTHPLTTTKPPSMPDSQALRAYSSRGSLAEEWMPTKNSKPYKDSLQPHSDSRVTQWPPYAGPDHTKTPQIESLQLAHDGIWYPMSQL